MDSIRQSWKEYDYYASQKRRRETFYCIEKIEPQRKGRQRSKIPNTQFRDAVGASMHDLQLKGWPKASLAVDFLFWTSLRQPAGIEHYAKNYQDLLQPYEHDGSKRRLLFSDDRQIKMLYVHCSHTWDSDKRGSVGLTCTTRKNAVADLELAGKLGYVGDDVDDVLFDSDPEFDYVKAERFVNGATNDSEKELVRFSLEWNRWAHRYGNQSRLLRSIDNQLAELLVTNSKSLILGRIETALEERTRSFLNSIGSPITESAHERLSGIVMTITLPHLPSSSGENKQFQQDVRSELKSFLSNHSFLKPLVVPLRITLLVLPPSQGIDLDNLALKIIGPLNDVFEPQLAPFKRMPRLRKPSPLTIDTNGSPLPEAPRTQVGVTSYQVIEMARRDGDPPEGNLILILGDGGSYSSTWSAATDYVDKTVEESRELDRYH